MNVNGKKILVFGDSLSASTSSPGGVLGAQLRAAGATVKVNGRVSRSAVNLWSSKNGEVGDAVVALEVLARPDIVIIALGTNDLGLGAQADAAAFTKLRDAFRNAQIYVIGPPAFVRADLMGETNTVYNTLRTVFGADRVIDWRTLSSDQLFAPARSGDGIHFTSVGASVAGRRLATAVLSLDGADVPTVTAMHETRWGPIGIAAVAAVTAIGLAFVVRRRNALRGLGRPARLRGSGDALPRSEREHVHKAVAGEIDDAVDRAVAAGATAPLEYIGAGAEGIVFCDRSETAYKVGRSGRGSLATEAQFFKKASQVPSIKQHIAKFKRYDATNDVIVRECVRQRGEKHGRPRRLDDAQAHDMAARIREAMEPYGFTAPERKGDSYVFVSGRGPVLVDGGFVHERGHELVKRVLDVLNDRPAPRTSRPKAEVYEGLISDLEWERGKTVPAKIADRLITRLQAGLPT